MGAFLSRVGSDNFYATYERNFERLKAETSRLQAKQGERQRRRQRLSSTIFWYSCAIFAALLAYGAWVTRQPPGTFSVRGHFLRVAPVFAWPPAAYLLYTVVLLLTGWRSQREAKRLQQSNEKMRKMLTDLKDSTHYDKTLQLLRKYDPEFAKAEAKQKAQLRLASPQQQGRPGASASAQAHASLVSPRQLGGLVGSGIRGAGSRMFPALDYLATSLIGDNPALTGALQEARSEGEALRQRLARAEARVTGLSADNAKLRERLGESPLPEDEVVISQPPTPVRGTSLVAADSLPGADHQQQQQQQHRQFDDAASTEVSTRTQAGSIASDAAEPASPIASNSGSGQETASTGRAGSHTVTAGDVQEAPNGRSDDGFQLVGSRLSQDRKHQE